VLHLKLPLDIFKPLVTIRCQLRLLSCNKVQLCMLLNRQSVNNQLLLQALGQMADFSNIFSMAPSDIYSPENIIKDFSYEVE
jgi:hypothetical protein